MLDQFRVQHEEWHVRASANLLSSLFNNVLIAAGVFGIVIYELASYGGEPYAGMSPEEVRELLQNDDRMAAPEHCDPILCVLLSTVRLRQLLAAMIWCSRAGREISIEDLPSALFPTRSASTWKRWPTTNTTTWCQQEVMLSCGVRKMDKKSKQKNMIPSMTMRLADLFTACVY